MDTLLKHCVEMKNSGAFQSEDKTDTTEAGGDARDARHSVSLTGRLRRMHWLLSRLLSTRSMF